MKKFTTAIVSAILSVTAITSLSVSSSAYYDNRGIYHAHARSNSAPLSYYSFESKSNVWMTQTACYVYKVSGGAPVGTVYGKYYHQWGSWTDKTYTIVSPVTYGTLLDCATNYQGRTTYSYSSYSSNSSPQINEVNKNVAANHRGACYW